MTRYPVKQSGPIEAWLRPASELWVALMHTAAAVLCVQAPWALLLTPELSWPVGGLFGALAVMRLRQGLFIVRYQRGLRRLPDYRLRADQIPLSRTRLFLGRGFRWTQVHTQRLSDTRRAHLARFVDPPPRYAGARRLEVRWEDRPVLGRAARLLRSPAWWNPVAPLPPLGGNPAIHAVEPHEHDVTMDLGERVGHALVVGTTRVGKTRLAEILIAQDIRRADVVIVFDPKGDADLLRRVYAEARRADRLDKLYVCHLGYPGAVLPLQRGRLVQSNHRSRLAHRQPVVRRRPVGGISRIRLAIRQRRRAQPEFAGSATDLRADPALRHQHRAAVSGLLPGVPDAA